MFLLLWIKRSFWTTPFSPNRCSGGSRPPMPPFPTPMDQLFLDFIGFLEKLRKWIIAPTNSRNPRSALGSNFFFCGERIFYIIVVPFMSVYIIDTDLWSRSAQDEIPCDWTVRTTIHVSLARKWVPVCTRFQIHVPRIRLTPVVHQKATWKYIICISFLWTNSRCLGTFNYDAYSYSIKYLSLRI